MKIPGILTIFFTVVSLGLFSSVVHASGVEYPRSVNFVLGNNIDLTFSSGSAADSVSMDATSVTVVVSHDDKFKISSPKGYELNNDTGIPFVCKDEYSELIISGDKTVVVTPSANRCSSASGAPVPSSEPETSTAANVNTPESDVKNDQFTLAKAKVEDVLSELTRVQTELESLSKNSTPICGYTRNLSYGSNGDDVATLQKELIMGEFLSVAPTGYFGAKTKLGVSAWQASNGIAPANGYFGAISRAKIQGEGFVNDSISCVKRNLHLGDEGDDVKALQNFLKSQGADIYPDGLVTGHFGVLTSLALQRLQIKLGITYVGGPGFGTLGAETRAKISSIEEQ